MVHGLHFWHCITSCVFYSSYYLTTLHHRTRLDQWTHTPHSVLHYCIIVLNDQLLWDLTGKEIDLTGKNWVLLCSDILDNVTKLVSNFKNDILWYLQCILYRKQVKNDLKTANAHAELHIVNQYTRLYLFQPPETLFTLSDGKLKVCWCSWNILSSTMQSACSEHMLLL